jgi:type II secretory ATPase GspE/PulE/Tfp pilus assembly ATPase PilB-like protein
LVREICSHCKASVELVRTATGWKGDPTDSVILSSLDPVLIQKYFGKKTSVRVYRGTGCSACHHTGYQGRFGIFEVLEITPRMSQLITAKADSQALAAQAAKDGMTTMLEDGLQKIISGRTTLSEIMRVTKG